MQGSVRDRVAKLVMLPITVLYVSAFLVTGVLFLQATDRNQPAFREWSNESLESLDQDLAGSLVIGVLATDFDPETMIASFRLLPEPSEDVGGSLALGSAWYLDDIDLEIIVNSVSPLDDGTSSAAYFEGNPNGLVPNAAIEAQLDFVSAPGFRTRPRTRWYPFDSYGYDLTVIASQRPWSEAELVPTNDTEFLTSWEPLSVLPFPYSAPVDGWEFRTRPGSVEDWEAGQTEDVAAVVADWNEGFASVEILVRRTAGVRILVGLVSLALFLNLLAVVHLTARVVSTDRPPSAQILIWVAALAFAAVAIRDVMPFAPPPGVVLDYLFFFPTLVAASVATVVLVFSWSRRSDYVA